MWWHTSKCWPGLLPAPCRWWVLVCGSVGLEVPGQEKKPFARHHMKGMFLSQDSAVYSDIQNFQRSWLSHPHIRGVCEGGLGGAGSSQAHQAYRKLLKKHNLRKRKDPTLHRGMYLLLWSSSGTKQLCSANTWNHGENRVLKVPVSWTVGWWHARGYILINKCYPSSSCSTV